jgi:hypothetical protein
MKLTTKQPVVKAGASVLWLNTLHGRSDVEEGEVLLVTTRAGASQYHVVWLEGHSSRNDSFGDDCLLAVNDSRAPLCEMGPFTGKMHLTAAGQKFLDATQVIERLKMN